MPSLNDSQNTVEETFNINANNTNIEISIRNADDDFKRAYNSITENSSDNCNMNKNDCLVNNIPGKIAQKSRLERYNMLADAYATILHHAITVYLMWSINKFNNFIYTPCIMTPKTITDKMTRVTLHLNKIYSLKSLMKLSWG
eukprot:Awhi_evm1s8863